ncbi:MAG: YIP1 family protein [Ignavibacteria bacterium]|nr:YIP1 family protein [Ignavibacteria bacterium]
MISCPVCGTGNRELAVTCASCHGFLQSKTDALDLFSTVWNVIEGPARAFRTVALATHKNFVLFLASLFGMSWLFTALWVTDSGDRIRSLFVLILLGLIGGPPSGIILLMTVSGIILWLGRRLGGEATFRNTFAVMAYATVPLCLSLLFVLPVELGVFGHSLFGTMPPASALKPMIYTILVGIQGATVLWFIALSVIAASVVHDLRPWKGALLAGAALILLIGTTFLPALI